jgi:hypothetical protein
MNIYLHPSGVKKELKNDYIGEYTGRLPSIYQEVEYIQSSWTQYINTWYTPSSNTKVDLKISNWNISSSASYIFWVYKNWVNNAFCITGNSTRPSWINGSLLWNTTGTALTSWWMGDWWAHTISLSSNWLYVDWTRIATVSWTFTATGNMFIFNNYKTDGSVISTERGAFKLYYFKIYNSWTLVRDFIPCYRKSDSVIWLYDLVNNKFYTNAGSWTFTKWPDVN